MIPRLAMDFLAHWKGRANRKPLIIRGARQVGKTTLVNEFAHTYSHFLSFNLEKARDLEVFKRSDDIHTLVKVLFFERDLPLQTPDCLIFIDEIQELPEAISYLRYFHEDYPNLHVIAAGSLLEQALGKMKAFPVGRVEYLVLHPVSFHEFLMVAAGDNVIKAYLEIPIPEYAMPRLEELYIQYVGIGGLPEVLQTWIDTGDLISLRAVYDGIITSFRDDVLKYASSFTAAQVMRHIIATAPFFAGQRIKFEGFGNSNYRSREVGEAMRSLQHARLLRLIYPTNSVKPPCIPDKKKSPRLQWLDTGLMIHSTMSQSATLDWQYLLNETKGLLQEHLTTQELIARHFSPTYDPLFWVRQKATAQAEVDLVYPFGEYVIPIEVKSGKQGRLRSLHSFIDRAPHNLGMRIYHGKFNLQEAVTLQGKKYTLLNLPAFLSGRIPEYAEWLVQGNE